MAASQHIGIMQKEMETTIVYWGYIGIMEKKMETTIAYWSYIFYAKKSRKLLATADRIFLSCQCKQLQYSYESDRGQRSSNSWLTARQ